MAICVYLNFNGEANEAVDFYSNIFGGEVKKMTYAQMPGIENFSPSEEQKNLIMHASIDMGDGLIYISDVLPGMGPETVQGNNVGVVFHTTDYDRAKEVYEALIDGGTVLMPFEKTFWSEGFGDLVDRFGVSWYVDVD